MIEYFLIGYLISTFMASKIILKIIKVEKEDIILENIVIASILWPAILSIYLCFLILDKINERN